MAIIERVKGYARTAKDTAQRQARLANRRMRARQLRGKIRTQHAIIGETLAPLILSGEVKAEAPEAHRAAAEARALGEELDATHREMEEIQAESDEFATEPAAGEAERRDGAASSSAPPPAEGATSSEAGEEKRPGA